MLIIFQYEIQQDAGRVLIREPESGLFLAAPPVCRHAPSASILPATRQVHSHPTHPLSKMLSPLVNLPFLSSPLAFVPIYLWSRRHPSTPISLFGLVTISAPYLPLALVGVAWMVNGTWKAAAQDLLGCAVGHVGWFMRDVWTREMVGRPTILSDAPDSLYVSYRSIDA